MDFNNRPTSNTYYVSTDRQMFWPEWLVNYAECDKDITIKVGDTYIKDVENNTAIKVNK